MKFYNVISEKFRYLVDDDIHNLIYESSCVAYDADELSEDIVDEIRNNSAPYIIENKIPGMYIKHYVFDKTISDNEYTIDIKIHCFGNAELYKDNESNVDLSNFTIDADRKMFINVLSISGYVDYALLRGTLSHEIVHSINYEKDSKNVNLLNPQFEGIYAKAHEILEDPLSKYDNDDKNIAYAIIMSFRTEESAMANSLFSQLKENGKSFLSSTEEYSDLIFLRKFMYDVDSNSLYYSRKIKILFDKTFRWFYNFIRKGYRDYATRVSKVVQEYDNYISKNARMNVTGKRPK